MANKGDSYVVSLKASHLGWGTHRYTDTRPAIWGESYLPIPIKYARNYNIVNSNGTNGLDVLGKNIFNCTSADGFFNATFKAQGCSHRGAIYAKQFSVNNNLKALGTWYNHVDAQIGDQIKVTWVNSTDIVIERI